MSEPFLAEIRMFAGNFAPKNWAYCDGQLLAVSQNEALYSLLGTTYGGDGRTTYALPDMRGRLPIHHGRGPGLSDRNLGSRYGVENVTLNISQIPGHTHTFNASANMADSPNPANDVLASQVDGDLPYVATPTDLTKVQNLNSNTILSTGESGGHSNMMPSLCLHFIIALQGVYPSRQ